MEELITVIKALTDRLNPRQLIVRDSINGEPLGSGNISENDRGVTSANWEMRALEVGMAPI